MDSWLVWQLTGGALHVTDASNASRTLMYDLHVGDWDDELLDVLGVPRAMLPEVRPSSEAYGHTAAPLLSRPIPIADEVEELAASVPDNGGVYLVPAFAGLGAPHWDPYARGTIVGLTRGTAGGHLARAALEGIAFRGPRRWRCPCRR